MWEACEPVRRRPPLIRPGAQKAAKPGARRGAPGVRAAGARARPGPPLPVSHLHSRLGVGVGVGVGGGRARSLSCSGPPPRAPGGASSAGRFRRSADSASVAGTTSLPPSRDATSAFRRPGTPLPPSRDATSACVGGPAPAGSGCGAGWAAQAQKAARGAVGNVVFPPRRGRGERARPSGRKPPLWGRGGAGPHLPGAGARGRWRGNRRAAARARPVPGRTGSARTPAARRVRVSVVGSAEGGRPRRAAPRTAERAGGDRPSGAPGSRRRCAGHGLLRVGTSTPPRVLVASGAAAGPESCSRGAAAAAACPRPVGSGSGRV